MLPEKNRCRKSEVWIDKSKKLDIWLNSQQIESYATIDQICLITESLTCLFCLAISTPIPKGWVPLYRGGQGKQWKPGSVLMHSWELKHRSRTMSHYRTENPKWYVKHSDTAFLICFKSLCSWYLINILTECSIATETDRAGPALPWAIGGTSAVNTPKTGVRETTILWRKQGWERYNTKC